MASEWQPLSLREAGVTLIDCDHRTPPAADKGYPYITIPQLREGRIDTSGARRITREHFLEWTRKARPQAHDVVLSRRCNPGESAVAPADLTFAVGQNLVLLRSDGSRVARKFLRWLVRGPEWWAQVAQYLNVGAVFDSLKCADIPRFRLRIPPLSVQVGIADFLDALDDKIELNRRMNETLEAMARALFKSWFVDFDPVRAKAAGRDPGLPKALADLFPSRLGASEIGEAPESWRVLPFASTVEVMGGGTPKTSRREYWDGDIAWFSVTDAPRPSDVWLLDTEKHVSAGGIENSAAKVLPAGTTILTARGTVGRLALVGAPMAMNQSCYGLVSKLGSRGYFTYFSARELVRNLQQAAHGTVFDTITRGTLAAVRVVCPPAELVAAFEAAATPYLERMQVALRDSRTLAALRDAFLPKLISGELRINDAERTAGAAA